MTGTTHDDSWRGVSDAHATLRARAASTPAQRLSWLEESLTLAAASGALAQDRARRQRQADSWRQGVPKPSA